MKIFKRTIWSLPFFSLLSNNRLSNLLVFLVLMLSLSACSTNEQEKETTEKDGYNQNLHAWVKQQEQVYDRYIVMNYGLCNYCDTKIQQAIINFDCLEKQGVAFVICTSKPLPKELQAYSSETNFTHYKEGVHKPLLEEFPRIYSVAKNDGDMTTTFNWYDAPGFASEIEKICARKVGRNYIDNYRLDSKGIPIAGSEAFMLPCDTLAHSYEEMNGISARYLSLDDQLK